MTRSERKPTHPLHALVTRELKVQHGVTPDAAFGDACAKGVAAAGAYLRKHHRRPCGDGADVMIVMYVLAYVKSRLTTPDERRLEKALCMLCEFDGHLALWALSFLGHEILSTLQTPEEEAAPVHRFMDTIVGINTSKLAIVSLGTLDAPAVRVCHDLSLILLTLPHDRQPLCVATARCWRERFSTPIAWTLERAAKDRARPNLPSLDVARAHRSTDNSVYDRWACNLVFDAIIGYPARA